MTKQLHAAIDINATPDRVWEILSDLATYDQWNPFIVHAEGSMEVGQRLTLRMQPKNGRAMTFRPTVMEVDPGRRLRWLGRLLLPGVFDGEHSFTLQPQAGDRVRLTQEERFSGLLVPLLSSSLDRGTLPAFEAMNSALRLRAEQSG